MLEHETNVVLDAAYGPQIATAIDTLSLINGKSSVVVQSGTTLVESIVAYDLLEQKATAGQGDFRPPEV